jgi:hypothetical protein
MTKAERISLIFLVPVPWLIQISGIHDIRAFFLGPIFLTMEPSENIRVSEFRNGQNFRTKNFFGATELITI